MDAVVTSAVSACSVTSTRISFSSSPVGVLAAGSFEVGVLDPKGSIRGTLRARRSAGLSRLAFLFTGDSSSSSSPRVIPGSTASHAGEDDPEVEGLASVWDLVIGLRPFGGVRCGANQSWLAFLGGGVMYP